MIIPLTRRITALRDRIRHGKGRGPLSPFYALSAIGITVIMGLMVDGGGALNATNKATGLAQEAARAAGRQPNVPAAVQGTEITVDPDAAVAAAQDHLAAHACHYRVLLRRHGPLSCQSHVSRGWREPRDSAQGG